MCLPQSTSSSKIRLSRTFEVGLLQQTLEFGDSFEVNTKHGQCFEEVALYPRSLVVDSTASWHLMLSYPSDVLFGLFLCRSILQDRGTKKFRPRRFYLFIGPSAVPGSYTGS